MRNLRVTVGTGNVRGSEVRSDFVAVQNRRIRELVLQFPSGCNGAVHAVLEDRHGRLVPAEGEDFAFSNVTLPLRVLLWVRGAEPAVRVVAWADAGNAHAHVVDVGLVLDDVEPPGVF